MYASEAVLAEVRSCPSLFSLPVPVGLKYCYSRITDMNGE